LISPKATSISSGSGGVLLHPRPLRACLTWLV
jgi:hypothetical protein